MPRESSTAYGVKLRKERYLEALLADDDGAPAKRRRCRPDNYDATRANPKNPKPERLQPYTRSRWIASDLDWLKPDTRKDWFSKSQYDYFSWEDSSVALARLSPAGDGKAIPGLPPSVFPKEERFTEAKPWRQIDREWLGLPSLDKPASLQILLGVVQLLHHDLRIFLRDTIFASAFIEGEEDETRKEWSTALRDRVCDNLYERWDQTLRCPEVHRPDFESTIAEFGLPDAQRALACGSPPPSPPAYGPGSPPGRPDGQRIGEPRSPAPGLSPAPPAEFEIPQMGPETAHRLCGGLMLLTEPVARDVITRIRERMDFGILSDAGYTALDWLAFLSTLESIPIGQALKQIAARLLDDDRYDTETRKEFGTPSNRAFLDDIPAQPFVWTVKAKRPKTLLPGGFPFPPFTEAGLYWWRALYSHCVGHMLTLKDTSDFHATDLLRFACTLKLFEPDASDAVPDYVRTMIRLTLTHFKYWFDEEPSSDYDVTDGPDDEMCFWSENHQIMFAQAAYLAGTLLPDDEFKRADPWGPAPGETRMPWTSPPRPRGRTGAEQRDRGLDRVNRWLDNRLRFGFAEWNSPGYYNEDITPLLNLVDFAPDGHIRAKAAMALDLLMFDMARFTCAGSFAVSAGRAYKQQKFLGWNQSIGDIIEIAFGTRGDFIETAQNGAIAFALSSYRIPDAIVGIGQDRMDADRQRDRAFIDRSRVSVYTPGYDADAPKPDTPEGVLFWWGLGNYLTHEMREATEAMVKAHPNLDRSGPFKVLNPDGSIGTTLAQVLLFIAKIPGVSVVLEGVLGSKIAMAGARGSALLPFPVNIVSWGVAASGYMLAAKSIARTLYTVCDLAKRFVDWALAWTGLTDTDEPEFLESEIIDFYHSLLDTYNRGSVLQRANLYTYSNGDAMLSSAQCHQAGAIAAQKQTWMASLGCDASVWTTCPWPDPGSLLDSIFRWETIGNLEESAAVIFDNLTDPYRALFGLARPALPRVLPEGPDEWSGSFALPMVFQHEHAAVIMYNMPVETRASVTNGTHAWFPTYLFDEFIGPQRGRDDGEGMWIFGRKGCGFVGLYSAQDVEWERGEDEEDDRPPYSMESLWASGARNVWICIVGHAEIRTEPSIDFRRFRDNCQRSRPEVHGYSGANALGDLKGEFRLPLWNVAPIDWPLFTFNYHEAKASVGGQRLIVEGYHRFENRYVSVSGEPPARGTPGVVPWGASRYFIHHPATRSWVSHDHKAAIRSLSEDSRLRRPPGRTRHPERTGEPQPDDHRRRLGL
jgi:hypothetical protein